MFGFRGRCANAAATLFWFRRFIFKVDECRFPTGEFRKYTCIISAHGTNGCGKTAFSASLFRVSSPTRLLVWFCQWMLNHGLLVSLDRFFRLVTHHLYIYKTGQKPMQHSASFKQTNVNRNKSGSHDCHVSSAEKNATAAQVKFERSQLISNALIVCTSCNITRHINITLFVVRQFQLVCFAKQFYLQQGSTHFALAFGLG